MTAVSSFVTVTRPEPSAMKAPTTSVIATRKYSSVSSMSSSTRVTVTVADDDPAGIVTVPEAAMRAAQRVGSRWAR